MPLIAPEWVALLAQLAPLLSPLLEAAGRRLAGNGNDGDGEQLVEAKAHIDALRTRVTLGELGPGRPVDVTPDMLRAAAEVLDGLGHLLGALAQLAERPAAEE